MQATMPDQVDYLVVGAGIQGLAVAAAIARRLELSGQGSGDGVLVVDKAGPGTGASWSASGSIHRFDVPPDLFPIIDLSLEFLTSDPVTFGFQQVGAIRECGADAGAAGATPHPEIQNLPGPEIGRMVDTIWPDLSLPKDGVLCRDPAGGYVGARQMITGLTDMARRWGVRIHAGTEVTRYEPGGIDGCLVTTTRGQTRAGQVVIAVGPFAPEQWAMLDLPTIAGSSTSTFAGPSGWLTQPCLEGDIDATGPWRDTERRNAPLLILDTKPIAGDTGGGNTGTGDTGTGDTISVSIRHGGERLDGQGLHVRLMPWAPIEPSGSTSWFHTVAPDALARRLTRFVESPAEFVDRPCTGGIALTPDWLPVADYVAPSVYWLADVGLGARGVGLAHFAASHLVSGVRDPALAPFALDRFRRDRPQPPVNAPLPGL